MKTEALTICIPSFDRHTQLRNLVENLVSQELIERCKIIIQDNCSQPAYSEILTEILDEQSHIKIEVCRNVTNVGMSGNILKCFEVANSEWLWIISDDDKLMPSAIKTVLMMLGQVTDDTGIIKFSSDRSKPNRDAQLISRIEDLIDVCGRSPDDFNSYIFLTNSIYRCKELRNYIEVGYRHAHTYVPHFMMISKYMDDGGKIYLSTEKIVDYVRPKVGYSYSLVAGIGVGALKELNLNLDRNTYEKYISLFFPHNDWKVLIDLRYYCIAKCQEGRFSYLSSQYILSLFYSRNLIKLTALIMFRYIIKIKSIFKFLLLILKKISQRYSDELEEMKSRYGKI